MENNYENIDINNTSRVPFIITCTSITAILLVSVFGIIKYHKKMSENMIINEEIDIENRDYEVPVINQAYYDNIAENEIIPEYDLASV